jgi:sialic acid synthase SpsE
MYIISELHNQYSGDLGVAEQMVLQSKLFGAQAVKIQLYDVAILYQNPRRQYLSLTFDETRRLQEYARMLRIDFFASFFDDERLDWCLQLDFPVLKIASILLERNPDLCKRAVQSGRRTIVSLGKWDWKRLGPPYEAPNVEYLYTVSKYPAVLEDLEMPDFHTSFFAGYSDHTIGTAASLYAIARGARILEKHYTLSPALQKETELAHAGAMTCDDLRTIRTFWDGVDVLERRGPAYAPTNFAPGEGPRRPGA